MAHQGAGVKYPWAKWRGSAPATRAFPAAPFRGGKKTPTPNPPAPAPWQPCRGQPPHPQKERISLPHAGAPPEDPTPNPPAPPTAPGGAPAHRAPAPRPRAVSTNSATTERGNTAFWCERASLPNERASGERPRRGEARPGGTGMSTYYAPTPPGWWQHPGVGWGRYWPRGPSRRMTHPERENSIPAWKCSRADAAPTAPPSQKAPHAVTDSGGSCFCVAFASGKTMVCAVGPAYPHEGATGGPQNDHRPALHGCKNGIFSH